MIANNQRHIVLNAYALLSPLLKIQKYYLIFRVIAYGDH